ncbi:hypothetical protein [Streptomyces albireticuli]|uniref:Uncharacterized protein n=1 Tax=Streptomyces albireticuli TaxID=1940 RepID=A0A2A2DAV0_9ACTN|nr:hypothetical protein [Streptomyces albireticuli]MCD9141074.1 hypothetical protein [Streptomyces albireticuli]MCD9160964.1 hypothetical protein [Streptomyces albireticuli]MCD9190978.1 hypothetical protein [Streptomyces albireticuli]PAU48567.1 hypothetical protein CK936_12575 [Streptomyces albireticuli]
MSIYTHPSLTSDAARWLLRRETSPWRMQEDWARGANAGIGLEHFNAVYLPADLVEDGMPSSIRDRDGTEAHLRAAGLTHGVIVPKTRLHYVLLVPPGTADTWAEPRTECRSRRAHAGYVAAPPPTRRDRPGAYWILPPPESDGDLCDPEVVRILITRIPIKTTRPGPVDPRQNGTASE